MIGASIPRREDARLLSGQGQFTDDMRRDAQVWLAFVRSPHAHAVVDAICTDEAGAQPGVLGIFTGTDLRADGVGPIPALLAERSGGTRNRDGSIIREPLWWAIAVDRVRHVGEPVAFVVATTREAARDAADLVEVDYRPLPAVVDAADALGPDAPQLFEDRPRNVVIDWSTGHAAAVERAFVRAAHVERAEMLAQRLSPAYIEPRSALASFDASSGCFTLEVCAQAVHSLASAMARMLGVPNEAVRCISRDVGGAFGGKNYPYPEYVACLWAARRFGRPAKWTAARTEGFLSDSQARDNRIAGEMAFDAEGRILGLRVQVYANEGAYIAGGIPFSISLNMERMISGLYAIPAIDLIVRGAVTNTVPVQVYRGVGRIEAVMIVERLIDGAARALGRDVAAMRRQNMVRTFPYHTPCRAIYDSGDYVGCLDRALAMADWKGFPARRADAQARGRLRGIGIGAYIEGTGGPSQEFAAVRVLPEGIVEVPVGSHSQGQSHETTFAQVVADRLGLPIEQVRIVFGDTDRVSRGVGTFASRSMVRAGSAAAIATDMMLAKAADAAAQHMEAAREDVVYERGRFVVTGTDRSIGLFELTRAEALEVELVHDNPLYAFANGCSICELEVDPETGAVELLRFFVVDDSGRSVNPMVVHGQMHGALVQGIGQALHEQLVYDADGQLTTGSFMDYALPRAGDIPPITVESRDVPSPTNALGVKGAGEGGIVAAPPAVLNALIDALAPFGVRDLPTPATPERIWRAMRDAPTGPGTSV